jgi:hypothetical protein
LFRTFENKGFAFGIVSKSTFLAKLQVLPVYAGCLTAILKIVMISMLRISADCTVLFPPLKTLILPLKSCRYLNFWQSFKYFRFILVFARYLQFRDDIDVAR